MTDIEAETAPDRLTPPPVYPIGQLQMPPTETVTLDNGIPLTLLDRGEDEVTRLTVAIAGGQAEAPSPAVPALAATLRLDGTDTHSADDVADILDYNGAWVKSGVHPHHHSLTLFTLNSRIAHVLPVVTDILSRPAFAGKEVGVEREKAARNLEMQMAKVAWHAEQAVRRMALGDDCPLAAVATPGGIRAISADDLRRWHGSTFMPEGIHLFLAGRLTPEVTDAVGRAFTALAASPAASGPVARREIVPRPSERRMEVIARADSLQAAVNCAIPAIGRRDPDYVWLRTAVMMLGGYFGSRLMLNIREDKGLTYGIGASLEGIGSHGTVYIETECHSDYAGRVVDEIRRELLRMQDPASYTAAEIDRAQSFMTTQLAAQLDSPFAAMDYVQNHLLVDTPRGYFEAQQSVIAAMTPESLADTARRYLDPEGLRVAVAGPQNK